MRQDTRRYALAAALLIVLPLPAREAGAATPLETVHPSYTLTSLRPGNFRPDVGGMAFLSDGRLVVGTWGGTRASCCPNNTSIVPNGRQYTGKVYVLSGVAAASGPEDVSVDTIASGLEDLMGLAVVNDVIYVSGGNRILRLNRDGGSGPVTSVDTVFILPGTPQSSGPEAGDSLRPVKGRSEWLYGLLYRNGEFHVNPSSMMNNGITQVNPWRGRALAVTPGDGIVNRRGSFRTVATGFRHATGLASGSEGSVWTNETQGIYAPTNKLIHLKEGAHYGYRHSGIAADSAWNALQETPAAVFLPQEGGGGNGNKNSTGVFSNSPGAPLYLTQGPYAGQFLMGDVTWGGIQRFFVEKVNGEWQGAGFAWMGGLESGAFRLLEGPGGDIYVGQIGTTGDWSWNGQYYGLQRLRYNGTPTFEMLAVRSRAAGMEVEFTLPVDTAAAKTAANWTVQTYAYNPTSTYGGVKGSGAAALAPLPINGPIQVAPDRKRVYLPLSGLVARASATVAGFGTHRIVEITLGAAIRSETAEPPRTNKAYYTLNAISSSQPFETVAIDPGAERRRLDEGLTWTATRGVLEVRVPFRGAYGLRLVDLRGRALASAAGSGAGTRRLPLDGTRPGVAMLEASGDGVVLRRLLALP